MFNSPPERTFSQTYVARILVFILVLGVVFIVLAIADLEVNKVPLIGWVIIAATLGLFAFFWEWSAKRRLNIHPEGVSFGAGSSSKDFRWEEIAETRYYQMNNAAIHFGLIGMLVANYSSGGINTKSGSLEIRGADGKKFTVNTMLSHGDQAIQLVLGRVNPRLKADIVRRLNGGESVAFGPVNLSRQGVSFKDKPEVAFNLAEIKFNGMRFRVKEKGKWMDAIGVPARQVPNIFVLLEIASELQGTAASPMSNPQAYMKA